MQQKNTVIFLVVCVLIFLGWAFLENYLWPRKPKPVPKPDTNRPVKPEELLARLWAVSASPAPDSPLLALTEWAILADREKKLVQTRPRPLYREELVARLWAASASPNPDAPLWAAAEHLIVEEKDRRLVQAVIVKPRTAKRQEIVLGSDSPTSRFHLKVTLTSLGGGVYQVVLNKFLEADEYGKKAYVDKARTIPKRMELVPQSETPSFLLFHYKEGKPEPDHLVDTLGKLLWNVDSEQTMNAEDADEHRAVFYADVPGETVRIIKTYTLRPKDYHVGLSIKLESTASPDPTKDSKYPFRYQLAGAHGLPIEGVWYTSTFRNAMVGFDRGGTGLRTLEESRQISGWLGGDRFSKSETSIIQYGGVAVQYFASVTVVDTKDNQPTGNNAFIEWARATLESGPSPTSTQQTLDDITVRLNTVELALPPGASIEHRYLLYNGPVKVRLLGYLRGVEEVSPEALQKYDQLHLNTMTDYQSTNWVSENIGSRIGWTSLLIWCTNRMHDLLYYLHQYVMPWSYGLCIVLLTVLVRGLLYPLSRRQAINGMRMQEKMQKVQPELKKLKEKYGNDFAALQQAQNELYRKHGINPFSTLGGCLLLLVQMPIFLGLYYCLQESIQFRLERFLWIENLGAPDMLVWWTESIPWLSDPPSRGGFIYLGPYFNLLPVVAVALMILQQKMTMPPPTDEQQEMQQKMMKYMMIVFGLFFYKVAAGLCIYFIASSLWGLAERKLIPKPKLGPATAPPKAAGGERGGGPARLKPKSPKGSPDGMFTKVREWWAEVLKQASKK